MKSHVGLIVFCAILGVGASDSWPSEGEGKANPSVTWMLKLVVAKLEVMEYKLQKTESMQLQLQKIDDKIQKLEHRIELNLSEDQNRDKEVQTVLHKLDQDIENVRNISQQIMNSLPQLHQIADILQNQCSVSAKVDYNSVVSSTKVSVSQPPTTAPTKTTTITTKAILKPEKPPFSSCKDVPSKVSGKYLIRVKNDSEPFEVYCEQESYGGGWTVFQYRYDGSLDFYRGWNEFRDGFGDLNKEFLLGLEKVHQITSGRKHELVVELKDFNGRFKYARFDSFEIGSESDQYDVKDIGEYSGTAGDNMSHNKCEKFSTKDRNNDESGGHCAQEFEGAWWHFWACSFANLNGPYMNAVDDKSMHWFDFNNNRQGLSYSRMMIREVE